MEFYKAHGLANDFLIIDATPDTDYARLAIKLCARHTGIGADGLLVLDQLRSTDTDFSLRIFNSDGSEAEMSGNGIRCAAAVLYASDRAQREDLRIVTISGIKSIRLRNQQRREPKAGLFEFEVNLGKPGFSAREVPIQLPELLPTTHVKQQPLTLANGQQVAITAISTGNPHCTLFVEDFAQLDWRAVGAELERHPAFPNRTNVEFVRVKSRSEIEARFWERGAGETASSGTGSTAAALASMVNGFTDRAVRVDTPAGILSIEWRADETVALVGPAEIICTGSISNLERE